MTLAVRDLPTVPLVAPARAHLPVMDGLRALAVAFVVIYHVDPDWLPGGFSAWTSSS